MGKITTIQVPEEIKEFLEKRKGDREWGSYLLDICTKAEEFDNILRNIT